MFRPTSNFAGKQANSSPSKQNNNGETTPSTIREIRSRTINSTSSSTATSPRPLMVNRRQAMSMERLNGSSSATSSMQSINNINEKEKGSPTSGSNNSINNSATSSPSRSSGSGGGLNRTASRVSRFRTAKAVFERLSSNSSSNDLNKLDRFQGPNERPRGTVASRYAAAAAARASLAQQSNTTINSPRSRRGQPTSRLAEVTRSASNNDIHRSGQTIGVSSQRSETSQIRAQPRVTLAPRRTMTSNSTVQQATSANSGSRAESGVAKSRTTLSITSSSQLSANKTTATTQAKPPSKDLIDKIVLEIARDAKQAQDSNCTIQDLSNCDISGIPETIDFDKCFQDVEMMTEEEARKLLSRKSESPSTSINVSSDNLNVGCENIEDKTDETLRCEPELVRDSSVLLRSVESSQKVQESCTEAENIEKSSQSPNTVIQKSSSPAVKCRVRFSEDPVQVYNTHAVEDYDRRNDDIDPVAASAEYEIEKSKESEGIRDDDNEEDDISATPEIKPVENFTQDTYQGNELSNLADSSGTPRILRGAPQDNSHDFSGAPTAACQLQLGQTENGDDLAEARRQQIESLEREVSLKRILEQNLRDLQSQYYEAVKNLDDYKGTADIEIAELKKTLSALRGDNETLHDELADVGEKSAQFEEQLNDIKESSQLLEKKYHRAKRIIKDMQSREESFTRREQLYQQKLDEIEYELGILINSVDRTIYDDGIKFFRITDNCNQSNKHQTQLDVFGLIKQILNNFNSNQSTQSAQIKQRIITIFEQQLANLMAASDRTTAVSSSVVQVPLVSPTETTAKQAKDVLADSATANHLQDNNSYFSERNQTYQFASHRLSQPNLPHPIGVGGQPTKLFHNLNPLPATISLNEPSPPQSVNSYPSSNSLNSLSNNNNISNNNNNINPKLIRDQKESSAPTHDRLLGLGVNVHSGVTSTKIEDSFQQTSDIQASYQTNEWHDKPVSEWTTTQVSTWLLALGLDQYISKFEDRNVNGQSLINLDSTVLKGLGVLNSNDRNLLKKKIRELRTEMEKEKKLFEKKLKENLKDRTKMQINGTSNKPSWKKGLLS